MLSLIKNEKFNQGKSELKRNLGETIFLIFFFIIFCIQAISLLYPMIYLISNSLKTLDEYYGSSFALPTAFVFKNYLRAFSEVQIAGNSLLTMAFNSVWIAVISTLASIGCSAIAAYSMAKFKFPGKSIIFSLVIMVQVLPIIGAGPAAYKFMYNFGFADNPLLIWLTWAGGFNFAFIVLYGYFKSISWNYAEAAYIDGAGNVLVMLKVMFPQALPAIASLMILNLIGAWNDYYTPMFYLKKYPNLALGIFLYDTESKFAANGPPVYFASIAMSMLPILIIFVSFQKMIMTSVTTGGLKG